MASYYLCIKQSECGIDTDWQRETHAHTEGGWDFFCLGERERERESTSQAKAISSSYSSHLDGVQGVLIAKSNPILSLNESHW